MNILKRSPVITRNKYIPLNEKILLWRSDTPTARSQIKSRPLNLGEDAVQPQGFRNMCEDEKDVKWSNTKRQVLTTSHKWLMRWTGEQDSAHIKVNPGRGNDFKVWLGIPIKENISFPVQ